MTAEYGSTDTATWEGVQHDVEAARERVACAVYALKGKATPQLIRCAGEVVREVAGCMIVILDELGMVMVRHAEAAGRAKG